MHFVGFISCPTTNSGATYDKVVPERSEKNNH